jgi:hypothetical protein
MRPRLIVGVLAPTVGVGFALAPVVASAKMPASEVHGTWTDPVGACTAHIVSFDPATGDLVCAGTSRWKGTWRGSTKWTVTGNQNPATGAVSGRIDEVLTGHAADGRAGKLTFVERLSIDPSGTTDIRGHITKGSGALAGSTGHERWVGTSAPDGSGKGTYSGAWREGGGR